ncbi:hypothetical protein QZM89_14235 [Burkholderia gladioli]|uniref:hypothetical protein n=1 Tax=Burkholderia gladioli TaxID=28095 RepID=UPI00227CCE12|nr:hypothetical protein [Burkholderia gladioli]MDN7496352.1 hypothetical protein [Burkholderia gladioli]
MAIDQTGRRALAAARADSPVPERRDEKKNQPSARSLGLVRSLGHRAAPAGTVDRRGDSFA